MTKIPFVKGRRINKFLCLGLSAMAALFLVAAAVCAICREPVFAQVMCFIAVIWAGFAAVYGIGWLVYARKEAAQQKKIERAAEILAEENEEGDDGPAFAEFTLPRDELINTAKKRLYETAAIFPVVSAVVFVLLYGFLLFSVGFNGIGHLILVALFCLLIAVPGIIVQVHIYRDYTGNVPQSIRLFPGKLIIDGRQLTGAEIENISVSAFKSANKNTTAIFREFTVKTRSGILKKHIDFRTIGKNCPRWQEYGVFLIELQKWAEQNRVSLTVNYMN